MTPDIAVVGGAGHVGLPLALVFASKGRRVLAYDIDRAALKAIARGTVPFLERGAKPLLRKALAQKRLLLSSNPKDLKDVPALIVTIGTPVDEFLNPQVADILAVFDALAAALCDDQLIVLRSTVYPGTTEWLSRTLAARGKRPQLAYCPERIVEGHAIEELQELPQIVSGMTPEAENRAAALFSLIAPEVVRAKPAEAEFAKLFSNAYRYIQFAISNQLYMVANSAGLDYYRILHAMQHHYPRMADLPKAGFAAGPCLFKDTMQLSAFYRHQFSLGQTAMLVNEGLPLYLISQISRRYDLPNLTVGLLGMAFKADSDDPRSSLSYKLKKELLFRARAVLTTDPHVKGDADLKPMAEVIAKSDLLFLCAPHSDYRKLDARGKPVVDIWNFFGKGALV